MDPITAAIIAALAAGAVGGLTEVSKGTLTDAYGRLKELLHKRFGTQSAVVQAVVDLEARPDSDGRRITLQEELAATNAGQDQELLAAAQQVLTLTRPSSN